MKLATIPADGPVPPGLKRDGRLVVVDDRAGRLAVVPAHVAPNLRTALEDWQSAEPRLRDIDRQLKAGTWTGIDGSAFIQHILLVRKARNAEPPADLREVPLMYQGVSDPLLGPTDDIAVADESYGIDLEAEVGVIMDEVPMGTKAADAGKHIRLLCLMNDVSLRGLIPRELAAGFGFFHGKPPTAFAPFAVTPDELGDAWRDGRVHLDMVSHINGTKLGDPNAGEMFFSFPRLIEHAAHTRPLPAGTILGSGTVSNEDESRGCSCLAERRTLETIHEGKPMTPFLRFGDRVHIDMQQDGRSVFGVIDQKVVRFGGP
jgi:fumarylacetoacetate (FAA) hydrolase